MGLVKDVLVIDKYEKGDLSKVLNGFGLLLIIRSIDFQ